MKLTFVRGEQEKHVKIQVEIIMVHLQKQKEVRKPCKENRKDNACCISDTTWPSLLPGLLIVFHL